jgi:hypothetical protein
MPTIVPYRHYLYEETEDVTTPYQASKPEFVESPKSTALCPDKCYLTDRLSIAALVLVIILLVLIIGIIFYCLKKYHNCSRGINVLNNTDKSVVS